MNDKGGYRAAMAAKKTQHLLQIILVMDIDINIVVRKGRGRGDKNYQIKEA